jgi:integrase
VISGPATGTATGWVPVAPAWAWPINPGHYDRSGQISRAELAALSSLGTDLRRRQGERDALRWRTIARLLRPLDDARAALRLPGDGRHRRAADDAIAVILARCAEVNTAYWGWPADQWLALAGTTAEQFKGDGPGWAGGEVRPYVVAFGYLLTGFGAFNQLGAFNRRQLCYKIFGKQPVENTVGQVVGILAGWGYQVRAGRGGYQVPSVLCQLLLHNRSPLLEDLSTEVLVGLRTDPCTPGWQARRLFAIQKAIASLGFCDPPVRTGHPGPAEITGTSAQWARYVQRWYDTSTLTPKVRSLIRTQMAKAGRWLAAEHPEITEPGQWTRQTCASWVAAVDRMQVGDYVQRPEALRGVGAPLLPATKAHMLMASRAFFRDCQEWEWIPRRFDPSRVLTAPRSVRALLGTNPRVIADGVWAKLLWAGLNLTPQDMPANRSTLAYPIELIRAVTLTWLFSGQRSDEIARLRVGCIRWQHQGFAIAGDSRDVLAEGTVCLLDVPTHKTGTAFTKPVDPLLGQAIEAWQAIRPNQPAARDRKTGERVDLLFSIRAHPIAKNYINRTIIPALCRKAGVPAADVRGNITSHRARSTIASQLYNAKEPMTLFELQAWLGHGTPNSTQFYAKITPNTLSKAYHDAGYFSRNLRTIEVLIDRDAVTSAAATGEPWQHYDLGHGYCAYTFFEQCPHRMACARCDFYTPKHSSKAQLLEAKQNLQRMLTVIPLTDDERAAVDDGHAALDQLLQRLADVPTPAGATPREIGIPPSATLLPIADIKHGKDG